MNVWTRGRKTPLAGGCVVWEEAVREKPGDQAHRTSSPNSSLVEKLGRYHCHAHGPLGSLRTGALGIKQVAYRTKEGRASRGEGKGEDSF